LPVTAGNLAVPISGGYSVAGGDFTDMRSDPIAGSLSERAYLLIRHKILTGEFPLGAPLSRRKLAAIFKMSFLPISEAVQRLESEGLVESRPRVGTRVRVPTPQDIRDCYIIREALETQAARLFCEKASSAERKELRQMTDRLEEMTRVPEVKASNPEFQFSAQNAHVAWHMRIAECAGCQPLADLLEKNQVLIFNWFFDVAAGFRLAPGRHRALMETLLGDNPDAAALAMGAHVRGGLDEIQASIVERFEHGLSSLRRAAAGAGSETPPALPWRSGTTRTAKPPHPAWLRT
jgi:DNA-binding GntR family transcriptional regulator